MNKRKRVLLTPLALAAVVALGAATAAPGGKTGQPWGKAKPIKPDTGRWAEIYHGHGNVTETRCQGMSRGANCITAQSRKDAARRAAAAREAAQGEVATTPPTTNGGRGKKK